MTAPEAPAPEVPAAVAAFVAAINAGDTDAFVALFAVDGVIDDWGTEYRGHERIRQWAQSDAIGAQARMSLRSSETVGEVTTVRFDWASSVFTGASTGIFTLREDRLVGFRIPPEH